MKVPAPQQPVEAMPQPEIPTEVGTQGDVEPQAEIPADENNDNPFANQKFDAGIDVDEDADPKTYIEKLTGKLAQKLRDFNETNQDAGLNKYVANGIISASVPTMTPEDAQDVIKKVKDNIGKETSSPETEAPVENEPIAAAPEEEIPNYNAVRASNQPPKMEAKIKLKTPIKESNNIDELIEKLLRGEKTELKKSDSKKKSIKKPFTAPKFK